MMRRALVMCLGLFLAQPASADTRIYVSGDLFAEFTRLSRTVAPDSPAIGDIADPGDGATFGGGARLGAFFAPAWSPRSGSTGERGQRRADASLREPIGPSFRRFAAVSSTNTASLQRIVGAARAHRRRADESRRVRGA
jgi:hypothetical protein